MRSVALQYNISQKNMADMLTSLKVYFPECGGVLMMLLLDEYSVGQYSYSSFILDGTKISLFFSSFF